MTREQRFVVDLEELRAVRWSCTTCGAAIAMPLDQTLRVPDACPSCRKDFTFPDPVSAQVLAQFLLTLKRALGVMRDKGRPVTLSLELDDPLPRPRTP